MTTLPDVVKQAWEDKEGPIVLTTVDAEGTPNAIYASCVRQRDESTWVVVDNFFNKTRANILAGSKGSLLFITKEGKSFQIKGTIAYLTEGDVFDWMKSWNPESLPGCAATALKVEEIFSGAEKLV